MGAMTGVRGPDGVGHGPGSRNVDTADVVLALVVDVGLGLKGG